MYIFKVTYAYTKYRLSRNELQCVEHVSVVDDCCHTLDSYTKCLHKLESNETNTISYFAAKDIDHLTTILLDVVMFELHGECYDSKDGFEDTQDYGGAFALLSSIHENLKNLKLCDSGLHRVRRGAVEI